MTECGSAAPADTGPAAAVESPAVDALIGDLDNAHEELRVAGEELTAQRDEIRQLLAGGLTERQLRQRLLDALPMAVVVTDTSGGIIQVNPAACTLLRMPPLAAVGKPLQSFIAARDRRWFRDRLNSGPRREPVLGTLAVRGRDGDTIEVEASVTSESDERPGERRWVWSLLSRQVSQIRQGPTLGLAAAFGHLAALQQRSGMQSILRDAATICGEALPASDAVSVTIGPPADPLRVASSSRLAQQLDGLQVRAGEGPCQLAWEKGEVVSTTDLAIDPRWPRLRDLARPRPAISVLAVPVQVGDESVGAINAYAQVPGQFEAVDTQITELLATAVAAIIHQDYERNRLEELVGQLEHALESRAVIDQAKGILIARHHCTPDEAFAVLVRTSRNHNIKLREVARRLVEQLSGRFDPEQADETAGPSIAHDPRRGDRGDGRLVPPQR